MGDDAQPIEFHEAKCPHCDSVVCDAAFRGIVRIRCANKKCKKRVWVVSDGAQQLVWTADEAPKLLQ